MTKPNGSNHEQHGPQIVFRSRQSEVAIKSTQQRETTPAAAREVEFTILPDGRIVDLIRSNGQSSTLSFLVWREGAIHLASHIEHDGKLLVPPKMDPTVLSALRLPRTVGNCSDVGELFVLIANQIDRFVDIPGDYSFLCAAFAVSTWFADRLPFAPYMLICGPMESGKTTLQRLLHCFCRRAIHCSAITTASLYRLTAQLRPTMIIDEVECAGDRASRELKRMLRGGNRQGAPILCGGKAYDNFGPKVITSRIPFDDAALVSRTVSITMSPSERDLPPLDLDAEQELANSLQPMLQDFRLSHYTKVAASQNPCFLKFPPPPSRHCTYPCGWNVWQRETGATLGRRTGIPNAIHAV